MRKFSKRDGILAYIMDVDKRYVETLYQYYNSYPYKVLVPVTLLSEYRIYIYMWWWQCSPSQNILKAMLLLVNSLYRTPYANRLTLKKVCKEKRSDAEQAAIER